jgi:hypothetical protein
MVYKFILYVGNRSFIGNNFILGQQRSWERFVLQSFLTIPSEILKRGRGVAGSLMVSGESERVACTCTALFVKLFLFDTFDYREGVRRIYCASRIATMHKFVELQSGSIPMGIFCFIKKGFVIVFLQVLY